MLLVSSFPTSATVTCHVSYDETILIYARQVHAGRESQAVSFKGTSTKGEADTASQRAPKPKLQVTSNPGPYPILF
jgi:hypothetical protein